jgi:diguanylate cyclase (GGDEF)-like protein
MTKIVTFEFERGNFQEGFEVKLRIDHDKNDDGQLTYISQKYGKFPAALHLVQNYQEWQLNYNEVGQFRMEIETAPSEEEKEISLTEMLKECKESSEQFLNNFKNWLIASADIDAQNFRAELGIELGKQSDAKILIHIAPRIEQSTASLLKKLPWHHLKITDNTYIGVETAFVPQESTKIVQEHFEQTSVKILAILGNSQGIDVEKDRKTLEQFKKKGADIVFLPEPERFEVVENLQNNRWDLLFFSGHSSSQEGRGRIFINQNQSSSSLNPNSLTIEDLKNSLKKAIEHGLRLAIFNSCDGLKLAEDLAHLNIPQVIIMREPVPDKVAQEFLKFFLDEFAKGGDLYLAVRHARDLLQDGGWNNDYPGVSCLPLIFQNPTISSFSWPKYILTNQHQSDIFCNIGRVLTSSLNPHDVFQTVMEIIGHYFSPQNWSLLLMEKDTGRLKFEIVMGTDTNKLEGVYMEKGEGIVGWVCLNGKPLLVEDAQNDPRFSPRADQIINFNTRSVVCAPLLNGNNRVMGAIELINKIVPPSAKLYAGSSSATEIIPSNKTFTEMDMYVLSSIGAFTGIAAENAFLHQKVKDLAMIDGLTGINNRHFFNEKLQREMEGVKRGKHTICMLMIDVDNFKDINDNYGHLTGDNVLCDIADILKSSVRESDVLARFGGDEFVVLMLFSGEPEGLELAKRIWELIRQWNTSAKVPGLKLGVSIGIHAAGPENVDNLLLKADQELYRCKSFRKKPGELVPEEQMH